MNILVIGEAPSQQTKNNPTLKRLNEWLDYLHIKSFCFTNVSNPEWSDHAFAYPKVIALGQVASKELNKRGIVHFKLPHPSPLNRQINDPVFIKSQLDGCKKYLEGSA